MTDLDAHVTQTIREYVDVAITEESDEGVPILRAGGEHMLWRRVQEAIAEAGWKLSR